MQTLAINDLSFEGDSWLGNSWGMCCNSKVVSQHELLMKTKKVY